MSSSACAPVAPAAPPLSPGEALEAALDQLGPFGLYHRYTLALLCLPSVLAAMYSLNYVFVAAHVPFRCVVPECEGAAPPYTSPAAEALLPPEQCQRYLPRSPAPAAPACDRDDYLDETMPCELFVYENMDTTFAEFKMACREWMRTLVGTVRNSALPVALLITGYTSDTFGRLPALCLLAALAGALGLAKACSVNYPMYLALEFLEAALGYGFNSAAYVMVIELARPSLRVAFACATGVAYGAGGALLAALAWRLRAWRRLLLVVHAGALLLPLYWLLLDESARWLHARGHRARAARVLRRAARWNKVKLDDEVMTSLEQEDAAPQHGARGGAWRGLLRSRALVRRLLLCGWCWVTVAFVYYGLTINSVSLSGDKYVNFALNMVMEIAASLLIVMALERYGRKRSIFCAFLLCGVACVTPFLISNESVALGLYFTGKLAITFAYNSLYVFTAELFPTRTRSSALAACSLVGRLGSVLAPQTPLLSAHVQALLYGGCSLLAALGVLLVPETRRARLPADVRGAETISAAHA